MTKDFEIASKVRLKPIREVAGGLGLSPERLFMYGEHIAKVKLEALLGTSKRARYVVVSGINPASSGGEGKTTVAIGLAMALWRLGKRAILTLREPSMGPVFGIKGGATGAGFNTAFAGNIQTMPGLPRRPAALGIDVDGQGNIRGLF